MIRNHTIRNRDPQILKIFWFRFSYFLASGSSSRTNNVRPVLSSPRVGLVVVAVVVVLQCHPRFKNLSSGCKSLELCADVASDVGIKAKSRLLRFL